jgi:hypothetical protein
MHWFVRKGGHIAMNTREKTETRIKNYSLCAVQWSLALLFLWAGGVKLVLPLEMLNGPVVLPGLLVRFIGVVETLSAIGLIVPWLLRIKPILTPLAAAGLAFVMIGATVITLIGVGGTFWLFPATVGMLAASVAYCRWRTVRSVDPLIGGEWYAGSAPSHDSGAVRKAATD